MDIKFQDSYHIVHNYIEELDFEELKMLATLHNLNCVLIKENVEDALLNNINPKNY